MARVSKSVIPAQASQALSTIDAQLASEVALLRNQINAPSGNKIRIEVAGSFTTPDGLDLGSSFQAVVVDFYNRNMFYKQSFQKDNVTPPDCYAMGKVRLDMAPEADSPEVQHPKCQGCWANEFKSGQNGKSKACQNRYWVALLVVDPDNPEAHNDPGAPLYILDLSPTNQKSFEGVMSYVAQALGAPIKAVITFSAKNVGTYAAVTASDPVPNPSYGVHFGRREEAVVALTRKPDFSAYEAAPPARGRGAAAPRRAAPTGRR